MDNKNRIPSVDYILNHESIKGLREIDNHQYLKTLIKEYLDLYKSEQGIYIDDKEDFVASIKSYILKTIQNPFKKVINASGIILHTNLGRAPIPESVYKKCQDYVCNYTNLEYNLQTGLRGDRNSHLKNLLCLLTGAEDAIIVNNNAAAVWLCLNQFAKDKEVLVSRSELIEIGGSFRIPDIMQASGAMLREVGTTNCTRLSDYSSHITENTSLIFKAHQSNYQITGHTESTSLNELTSLAKEHNLISYYDLGSGLIRKSPEIEAINEMSVEEAINSGIDLISFSTDKLMGGPQAGIIIGKQKYISLLAKNPLMRVLRVDKLTLSILFECLSLYLNDALLKENPVYRYLCRDKSVLKKMAIKLVKLLKKQNIQAIVRPSLGKTGGGTLPNLDIKSWAVEINSENINAEQVYKKLRSGNEPIICILKEGELFFDMLCLSDRDLASIALKINQEGQ